MSKHGNMPRLVKSADDRTEAEPGQFMEPLQAGADSDLVIPTTARDEAYRTDLTVQAAKVAAKVIIFTGSSVGAGVSSMVANFASALARDPRLKVLLIDANFRNPQQHELFQIRDSDTLLDAIANGQTGESTTLWRRDRLYVLPSGGEFGEPGTLFRTLAFERLLKLARERFDYVLLDTPTVHEHAESRYLASIVDGVALVVESGKTRKGQALSAKRKIENAGGKVIGVVLNRVVNHIPAWLYNRL